MASKLVVIGTFLICCILQTGLTRPSRHGHQHNPESISLKTWQCPEHDINPYHHIQTHTRPKREADGFAFEDCGTDPNRPIFFKNLTVSPTPIQSPGKMIVGFEAKSVEDLPENMYLKTRLSRVVSFIGAVDINTCWSDRFGTCDKIPVCDILAAKYDPCDCEPFFLENDFPCGCPLPWGDYQLKDVEFTVPKISGALASFAEGEYSFEVQMFDEDDKEGKQLGCLRFSIQLEAKKDPATTSNWWGDWGKK